MTIKINITAAELAEFLSALPLTSEQQQKEVAVTKQDCLDDTEDDAFDATDDIFDLHFIDQMNRVYNAPASTTK